MRDSLAHLRMVGRKEAHRAVEELIEVSRLGLPAVPGYELIEKLGCGGFGSVYLARALDGSEVALKVVSHGGRLTDQYGRSESHATFDPEEAEHEASVHRRPQQQMRVLLPRVSLLFPPNPE